MQVTLPEKEEYTYSDFTATQKTNKNKQTSCNDTQRKEEEKITLGVLPSQISASCRGRFPWCRS